MFNIKDLCETFSITEKEFQLFIYPQFINDKHIYETNAIFEFVIKYRNSKIDYIPVEISLGDLTFPTIPLNKDSDFEDRHCDVIFALTQYDDYKDFCERCSEFRVEVFMTEQHYINWFNEMWACPDLFKTTYDWLQMHKRIVYLENHAERGCRSCMYFADIYDEGFKMCTNEIACTAIRSEEWKHAPFYEPVR